MEAEQCSTPKVRRIAASTLRLWLYLFAATLWASFCVTSNGPTNQFTTLLLLPVFGAASFEFFQNFRITKCDQFFGAIAYAFILGWMIQNVYDLVMLCYHH